MMGPIGGIGGLFGFDPGSSDIGEIRDARGLERIFPEPLFERLKDGIHHGRVEGVRGMQAAANDVFRFELLLELDDIRFRPRYDT